MARPTLLTQPSPRQRDGRQLTYAEAIVDHVGVGQGLLLAAEAAGIAQSTVMSWQRRGTLARDAESRGETIPEADRPFVQFVEALETAKAQGVLSRIANIRRAAQPQTITRTVVRHTLNEAGAMVEVERTTTTEQRPGSWQADAWYLERQYPAEFGRRMELTGADGAPLVPESDRAAGLGAALAAFQAGQEAKAEVDAERKP